MDFEPTIFDLPSPIQGTPKEEPLCVVRLTKSRWADNGGMHVKTTIRFLRRKCVGFNYMEEEVQQVGAPDFIEAIENLETLPEGIYELHYDGMSRDYETGHYEADGYKLVPYKEEDHVAKR